MEMDKAFLLQKQIKENSEDLHKEFLDMEAWEEQMKRIDLEIRNSINNKTLPAIRSKIKKKCVPTPEVSKDEKPKKTKLTGTLDYSAWNEYDVDKACKEIEETINSKFEKVEKSYEIPSKKELEEEHKQAEKIKNEGNILVKKQQYAKAVGKYSEAIKVFPYDAIFYANRALCQLKLNNLYSAEADCTAAIELDKFYLKAYHRRATVRMELKNYKDAKNDLEIVLQLNPTNTKIKSELAHVEKKIESTSKTMIISGEKKNKNDSIEKAIGEKLLGKKLTNLTENKNLKHNEENKNKSTKIEESHILKDESSMKKETIKQKNNNVEKTKDQINKKLKTSENNHASSIKESSDVPKTLEEVYVGPELPSWLPKFKKGISIVQPLTKSPRRIKQTLKRISINEIDSNESIFKDIEEVSKEKTSQTFEQLQNKLESNSINESENNTNNTECCNINNVEVIESLPPPPKSSVGFITNWRKNISPEFRRKYLKQIIPRDIPDIFKEAMESNIFSEILSILNTEFISNADKVYDLLIYFAKVKRFRALILFMTQKDKEALKNLFEYCKTNESKSDEEISCLHAVYEM